MSCPLCGNAKALQLLTSFRCPNNGCENFDESQEPSQEPSQSSPEQEDAQEPEQIISSPPSCPSTPYFVTDLYGTWAAPTYTTTTGSDTVITFSGTWGNTLNSDVYSKQEMDGIVSGGPSEESTQIEQMKERIAKLEQVVKHISAMTTEMKKLEKAFRKLSAVIKETDLI